MTNQKLLGMTALVTGASHGIGLACARHLAEDGATVVITGRRQEALIQAREELLRDVPGARIELRAGDARDERSVEAAVNFAWGLEKRLDILVNTVGGHHLIKVIDETPAGVRDLFELNFMSAFLAVHHALPKMARGGAIVCISSTAANISYNALSSYSVAKAALERFVKAAACEIGSRGIRINAVRPGVTQSAESIAELGISELVERYNQKVPLGRIGVPDDLASVVRFLAGPESSYVTGQIFSVDGGQDQCRAPEFVE
jgi:NAD(P)-dependent dehydrogenase (short-subunit alcohol dehydrogenase family)